MTKSPLPLFVSLLLAVLAPGVVGNAAQATAPPETAAPAADREGEAPPAYTMTAPITRMVLIRLRNKTDVVEGLKQAIEKERIHNAVNSTWK